ncbi:MAG TPA: hypothetical protein VG826_03335 [Pirellulales bacterium]|nr:hypothetical protein [Pirellulales bacterium]
MLPRRTVLVVDPLDETHEVLRTALSDRGVDVLGTHDSARGLALARQHRPHLIVLDLEADSASSTLADRFASEAADRRLVILGSAKRDTGHPDGCQVLAKPYHYAPLIRKIEELLAA